MKQIILFLIMLLYHVATCQEGTIDIEFVEATPIWVHTIEDTTFVPEQGQPYWTKYSSLWVNNMKRNNDYLYILSNSEEGGAILDNWGFVLDKIDIRTGELIWKHQNTKYIGGEQDYYNEINIRNDGNLELVGVERYGTESNYCFSCGAYFSNSIRKVIDANDGKLLKSYHAEDSICSSHIPSGYFKHFPLIEDSLYLNAYTIGEDTGEISFPLYDYGSTFHLLDKNLDKIQTSRILFEFDTLGPIFNRPTNFYAKG
ncbi:MAG: hypothetical protein R2771_16270 [Saprospiraceae bacterium]